MSVKAQDTTEELRYTGFKLLLSCIPEGTKNAIPRSKLVSRLGLPDRKVRKMIEEARCSGFIIANDQSGKGYYQPDDIDDIERQYWQNRHRAMTILSQQKHLRKKLHAAGRKVP